MRIRLYCWDSVVSSCCLILITLAAIYKHNMKILLVFLLALLVSLKMIVKKVCSSYYDF